MIENLKHGLVCNVVITPKLNDDTFVGSFTTCVSGATAGMKANDA